MEQARILRLVLSNYVIKDLTPYPTYNAAFDVVVNSSKSELLLGDRDSNPDSAVQSRMSYH